MRFSVVVLTLVVAAPVVARPGEQQAPASSTAAGKKDGRKDKDKKAVPAAPAKVYTNEDLKDAGKGGGAVTFLDEPQPGATSDPGQPTPSSSELGTSLEAEAPVDRDRASSEEGTRMGEQGWRERVRDQREVIKTAEAEVAKLEALLRDLELDRQPSPTDLLDPARLQKREASKADARDQLEAMRSQLAAAQKALEDLQEEARRAGVPPAWLEEPERDR